MATPAGAAPAASDHKKVDRTPFVTMPRVAPEPVSSGVSFRKLPEATLLQVIKCCQHYERRCSGLYSAKTPAARFLFDLSREVQDLVCLLRDRALEREKRIRMLEGLVKDWCEVFGDPGSPVTSTGIVTPHNTPREVAAKLVNQAKEIAKLTTHQHKQTQYYENELELLRRAMRDQARAVRDQFHVQAKALEETVATEHSKAVKARVEVETEKVRLQEAWSQTVEAEVKARMDASIQATCVEALQAREEATKAAQAAHTEAKELRSKLTQTEAQLQEVTVTAETTIARLTQETQTQSQRLVELEEKVTRDVATMKRDAARKVEEARETERARFDADRVDALERHCEWLARRVTELQDLLDATQRGLASRAYLWPAAAEP